MNTMRRMTPGLLFVALIVATGCATSDTARDADAGQAHLVRARHYRDRELSVSALVEFALALEDNPRLIEAHIGIGRIYLNRGEYPRAADAFQRAARINSHSFDAHYYFGLAQQLMGRIEQAIHAYHRALTIDADSADANRNLASAYLQLNRLDLALRHAERAVELDPQSQGAWANLAAVYSLLGEYQKAVHAYRRAAEPDDMPEPLLLGLADAHLKLGNLDRAINVLQSVVHRSPSALAYERLGYAQFKQHHFNDALASYEAAHAIDPDDTAVLNGLGVCLMTRYLASDGADPSQWEQAIAAWRRSITLRSQQPRIVELLSRYRRVSTTAAALKELERK